jgi:putative ABC transport system permease protein
MFKNYLKIVIRNLLKQKLFSFINISGLAIGIACGIIIILYVKYETSYDQYHEKAKRTYRVAVSALIGDTPINQTYSSAITFLKLLEDFPEIETGVKILKLDKTPVFLNKKIFYETKILAVDSTFYDVFTIPLIYGDPKTVLSEPNTIVLTRNAAIKYFGKTDIIGKVLTLNLSHELDKVDFKVSGVSENMPENSHFHYDMLVSLMSFPEYLNDTGWTNNNFISYVVLKEGTSKKDFDEKLKDFTRKYMGEEKFDEWVAKGNYWTYYLQPLTDIHLNSNLNGEFEPNGNQTYVYMFSVISVIILLIACINFMNLSTARSSLRAKEVGLRKVVGSGKNKLIFQFLFESIFLSFIALIIALMIVEGTLLYFRDFVGKPITINYFENINVILILLLLGLLIGIVSGSYPAFVLSSFVPVTVLKKNSLKKSKHFGFRNVLVVFQFAISIFLIVGAIIVYQQLRFLQNKNLGFDKEQVLVIKNPGSIDKNITAFKQALSSHISIVDVSGSNTLPGTSSSNIGFRAEGVDKSFTLNLCICDYNFQNTLKLEMLGGRFFSEDFPSDSSAVILNQKAVELLGWDDPIGREINNGGSNRTNFHVIGVVKDYHYESLHQEIRPMGLFLSNGSSKFESYISVRIETGDLAETIEFVNRKWNEFTPGAPFEFSFLNEDYDNLYINEKQTEQIFSIFSFLAIVIACMGLFGLVAFVADRRVKEIGIRKILGASVTNIVMHLSKNFTLLVLISNFIAWPVAWYVMNKWLEDFAYRIEVGLWMFFLAGGSALLIAFLTVSTQAIRAALANPVESLRYE